MNRLSLIQNVTEYSDSNCLTQNVTEYCYSNCLIYNVTESI